jgi:hypothetical protein
MRRRVIYAGTIVAVFAMIGGFAMASFSFNTSTTAQQGSQTVNISSLTQLSYIDTNLSPSSGTATAAGTTASAASSVGSTAEVYCVSAATCNSGDEAEVIVFNVVANPSTTAAYTFNLVISVDAGGTTTSTTTFYSEAASATASTLTLYYDLGSAAPGAVTSVNIIGNAA